MDDLEYCGDVCKILRDGVVVGAIITERITAMALGLVGKQPALYVCLVSGKDMYFAPDGGALEQWLEDNLAWKDAKSTIAGTVTTTTFKDGEKLAEESKRV